MFDHEAFGAAMGQLILESIEPLKKRIDGMQSKLDKCMTFAGDHQSALDYPPGSLVRRDGGTYVSVKAIKAGSVFSSREGGGWERVL